MLLQRQAQAKEVARMQQLVDSRENEVIRLELAVGREVEARRAAEEQGRAAGGFDNSLDISQIEREAAEGTGTRSARWRQAPTVEGQRRLDRSWVLG